MTKIMQKKTLGNKDLRTVRGYIAEHGRKLELSIFDYYFNSGSIDDVISQVELFQNSDGGFGHGIEPDFMMINSSPMATAYALGILDNCGIDPDHEIIERALKYLESSYDHDKHRWFVANKKINNYPHAPWWSFNEETQMTPIDSSLGNPTAEILGLYIKYSKKYNIPVDDILDRLIHRLLNVETDSEHEIYSFLRMFKSIPESLYDFDTVKARINYLINRLIVGDNDNWNEYTAMPYKFQQLNFDIDGESFVTIDQILLDANIDYLINLFQNNGVFIPEWSWGMDEENWAVSKRYWTGILSLERFILFKNEKRLY